MERLKLDPSLILGPVEAKDKNSALIAVAQRLVGLGYARRTYPAAVVERERVFPTGLPTTGAGVAIPHCDSEHVLKPAIAVAKLSNPVKFGIMGSFDDTVMVDIIFMLAIKDPSSQIDTLRQVATLVQEEEFLDSLKSASNHKEVMDVLSKVFEIGNNVSSGSK